MTREEAIQILRTQYPHDAVIKEALGLLIPELSKSEDERIRKALIDALKVSETIGELKFRLPYPTREECIAYLEKQKEQNGEDEECIDFTIYHPLKNGEGKYECIPYSFYGSLTSFSEGKDLIDFLRTCFYTKEECNEWIEKQKEQKPADKEQDSIAFLEQHGYTIVPPHAPVSIVPSSKAMITEWSEEDEIYLQDALWCVEKAEKSCKDEEDKGACWSAKRWLKSLRPVSKESLQPHWKPSEEQMDALKELIDDANKAGWVTPGATELYEQLKKL